jgi:hypothetical protein
MRWYDVIKMAPRVIHLCSILALSAGCSTLTAQSIQAPPPRVRSIAVSTRAADGRDTRRTGPGPVEQSLASRGVRFGTDGSSMALFANVREHYPVVPVRAAVMGDLVFFDMGQGCGGHVGLVETVEPSGRIGFRERRDGDTRHSYATPSTPYLRRDARGRIMNTFLRAKHLDDRPDTAYFAGEMLCAIFRVAGPP